MRPYAFPAHPHRVSCVRPVNDLPAIIRDWGHRIHFIHLRSTKRDDSGNFHEAAHLEGDVDMYAVMKELCIEQQKREHPIPMRPDHGHKLLDDLDKPFNPGYPAIGVCGLWPSSGDWKWAYWERWLRRGKGIYHSAVAN